MRAPRVVTGDVLTGDLFVASSEKKNQLVAEFEGDAIEMEGAAVAQVCWQLGRTPLVLIRGISDAADDSAYESAAEHQQIAADNAAKVTAAVIARMARSVGQ
jgi:adenosylhomocysteine nucleosidase